SISHSTINSWLNRKAVPTGRKNERYLTAMVAFLQAKVKSDTGYEPLSAGEWGRLLHEAQAERAAGKKSGRPRRSASSSRGVDAYGRGEAVTAGKSEVGLALYGSGQVSDAPTAYQHAGGVWGDQLGTERSKALQDLQQQMLNRDPALSHPSASAP